MHSDTIAGVVRATGCICSVICLLNAWTLPALPAAHDLPTHNVMLHTRAISSIGVVLVGVVPALFGPWGVAVAFAVLGLLALHEIAAMLARVGYPLLRSIAVPVLVLVARRCSGGVAPLDADGPRRACCTPARGRADFSAYAGRHARHLGRHRVCYPVRHRTAHAYRARACPPWRNDRHGRVAHPAGNHHSARGARHGAWRGFCSRSSPSG